MVRSVCLLILVHLFSHCGIELGVHDNAPLLPIELPEVFFGRAAAIVARGIDFVMAVGLEDVKDLAGFGEVGHSGLFLAIAYGHGPEDDIDCGFGLWCHGVLQLLMICGWAAEMGNFELFRD